MIKNPNHIFRSLDLHTFIREVKNMPVAQFRVTSAKAAAVVMGSALTLIVISIKSQVSPTFSIQLFCHYTLHEGSQVKSGSRSLNECNPYK